jgi:hypothetical protein
VELEQDGVGGLSFVAPTEDSGDWVSLELTAIDDEGAAVSDGLVVQVLGPSQSSADNHAPWVTASGPQSVPEGGAATLTAEAGDDDGEIQSVLWIQIAGPAAQSTGEETESIELLAPSVSSDVSLHFEVTVVDDSGASATATIQILVLDMETPPIADAGPDQGVEYGDEVVLLGLGTDAEGPLAASLWSQTAGTPVILANPLDSETTFIAPSVTETLSFQWMVQDAAGLLAWDSVSVEVTAPNLLPVVDAGPNQFVQDGDDAELLGTASDPDGVIVSVEWIQTVGTPVQVDSPNSLQTDIVLDAVVVSELLVFSLLVTDDSGGKAADQVEIEVEAEVDPCCSSMVPLPGTPSICLDPVAFSCVASYDAFCSQVEWDEICVEDYTLGTLDCPAAQTCGGGP